MKIFTHIRPKSHRGCSLEAVARPTRQSELIYNITRAVRTPILTVLDTRFKGSALRAISLTLLLLIISSLFPCYGARRTEIKRALVVKHVTFEGNKAFSDKLLQKLMATKPPSLFKKVYYKKSRLNSDLANIQAFYNQQGYLDLAITDTVVTVDTVHSTVSITLDINEGPLTKVGSIEIQGNTILSNSTLGRLIKLKQGDPLLSNEVQNAVFFMVSLYADSGYIYATVTPEKQIDTTTHVAAINFKVNEGSRAAIANIDITGLQKTRRFVVTRELEFKKGEIINYSKLLDSQRRLYMTGLFRSVFIIPRPGPDNDSSHVIVMVRLNEKISSALKFSVGYGSIEKIMAGVEVSTINLAGTGEKIALRGNADFINRGGELSFTEPWTFGFRLKTDLNLLYGFEEQPAFHLYTTGMSLAIGRSFSRFTSGSLTARYENSRLASLNIVEPPGAFRPKIRSVIADFKFDSRNDLFNATRGFYQDGNVELAGSLLGGNNSFTRTILTSKYFYPFSLGTIIATAYQVGWIAPFGPTKIVSINERFFTGGPNSLRGFGYQRVGPLGVNGLPLGGNFMMVGNLEIRRVIYTLVSGVVFVDGGNVWSRVRDFKINSLRVDVGTGFRVNTPIGLAGLDYGINVKPRPGEPRGKLYLRMGQAF
jgi:outer membrane protein insertion porin family